MNRGPKQFPEKEQRLSAPDSTELSGSFSVLLKCLESHQIVLAMISKIGCWGVCC